MPFNAAIQPGPKTFDLNLTEFSITDERKQAVDFSAPYYDVKQAVVALSDNPFAGSTNLAGLAGARLGAQVGTTSYDAINNMIKPTTPASVFNTNDDAKLALSNGQVDAIVVDLPTAFFITSAELPERQDRRAAAGRHWHARAVRRGARQGQPADVVRVGGGGRAAVGGDADGVGEAMADGGGQRPRAGVSPRAEPVRGARPCRESHVEDATRPERGFQDTTGAER